MLKIFSVFSICFFYTKGGKIINLKNWLIIRSSELLETQNLFYKLQYNVIDRLYSNNAWTS